MPVIFNRPNVFEFRLMINLEVRWMAPEALKDGKFTMKSDVWYVYMFLRNFSD